MAVRSTTYVLLIFLLSMLSQAYNIIINNGVSEPGHCRELVDGIKITYKRFLFHLMESLQLPGLKYYGTQMAMHYATQNADVSLAREFQKHLSMYHIKME